MSSHRLQTRPADAAFSPSPPTLLACGARVQEGSALDTWRPRAAAPRRRGVIFITALGIILVLTGMVLVFLQNMRTEAVASANRIAYLKADAIEQAAERWTLAQVQTYCPDAVAITTQVPAEAIQVGDGYFWIITPNPATDQQFSFGITDESSKLNLNAKTSVTSLQNLPTITQDIAQAIIDWRSPLGATNAGNESNYYQSLPDDPYETKNAPYETVEELLLVEGVTADLLFGYDINRNGVIDDGERQAAGFGSVFSSGNGTSRGIFNYFTVYSSEPNTASKGGPRVNVNAVSARLTAVLSTPPLSAARAQQIMERVGLLTAGRRRGTFVSRPTNYLTVGAFLARSGMTGAEIKAVVDKLTTTTATSVQGLVNVNTASEQALMCLNELTQSDADNLIAQRATAADTSTVAWVFDALPLNKAEAIVGQITARSFQYAADIIAASGDGRSFKRVRIVVDARKQPAAIVYRRDLTALGWPLTDDVRNALKSGKPVPRIGTGGSSGQSIVLPH